MKPKPWYYKIQYGPDGEENYAWVYDGGNNMVATMRTHHAQEIVGTMNAPSITAFLDAILEDPEALNLIIAFSKSARRAEDHRMWSGVIGSKSKNGNPDRATVLGVIEALKQEIEK